jgi:hypothetical protein
MEAVHLKQRAHRQLAKELRCRSHDKASCAPTLSTSGEPEFQLTIKNVSTTLSFQAVFFLSERSLQLGPVSDIPSKIYCHALALGVGFSHSEKTLLPGESQN